MAERSDRNMRTGKEPFLLIDYQFGPEKRISELRGTSEQEFKTVQLQVPSLKMSPTKVWSHYQYFVEEELREEHALRYVPTTYKMWPMHCCRQDSFGKTAPERNEFHDWMEKLLEPVSCNQFLRFVFNNPTDDEQFRVMEALEERTDEIYKQNIRLGELHFTNMHLDASCPDDMVKTYTKNITKLLKSQPEIEVITFINAAVCLDRAFRILKAIRQGPCLENTLKILNLTGFFAPEDRQEETLLLCNFISEFSSLTELYLSYTSMNDRLLDSLGKYQGITLQKLGFTVNENDPDSHEISSYAWQNLLNACPNLRVEIVMKIVDKQLAVDTVLKREIPVCKLDLSLKCIGDEFTLLCEGIMEYVVKTYCNSIEKLNVKVDTGDRLFQGNVISLMKRMKKLTCLQLHANMPLSKCLLIAHCRMEDQTNATKCYLHCLCRSEDDFCLVRDELLPVFEKVRGRGYDYVAFPCKFRRNYDDFQGALR